MSEDEDNLEYATPCSCCASCGITEMDDIELVPCDNCRLYRYCSDECRENHKSEHEEDCKKLAAQLQREYLLFKQPESSHMGDCPICCLPLSLDKSKSAMMSCCSKVICKGCLLAKQRREDKDRLSNTCPFCRTPEANTVEEYGKRLIKRIEANDPVAMSQEGAEQHETGNYSEAVEYFTKAAELGDADAHYRLSPMYYHGQHVEKDIGKYIHHLEEAAIGGHPEARYYLGCIEESYDNDERAVKHFIIAANLGYDESLANLKKMYQCGTIRKEDFAAALRAHHAAVGARKSEQREAAEEYCKKFQEAASQMKDS